MRKRSSILLLLGVLWPAVPAGAAPILMNAELTFRLTTIGTVTLTGTGTVDVAGGLYQIPAGIVAQTAPLTVPVTSTSAIASLKAVGVSNLAASLSLGGATAQAPAEVCVPSPGEACVAGGGIGGPMALVGSFGVTVIPGIVVVPLDLNVLLIGQGGSVNQPFSADAAVWTTRTASANTGTGSLPPTTHSLVGSTTIGGGITLVTATFISACGNTIPLLTSLTLTPVVPEPETLLLLGLGAAGLLALRRSR